MIELNDQMGRKVVLPELPKKIISLVPSQTELLFDLGLGDAVIGITKFCIHPKKWFEAKTRVGGTKNLDLDKIRSLNPDLIIGNMEENTKEEIEALEKAFPVYMSDVLTIESAYEMMLDLGVLTGKEKESKKLVKEIKIDFESLPKFSGKVYYFMWKNPLMVAGKATFIGQIIEALGFTNLYDDAEGRYSIILEDTIKNSDADFCLLSTEPFPYKKSDVKEFHSQLGKKAIIVDGEMFSWYGSRMKLMKRYFEELKKEF